MVTTHYLVSLQDRTTVDKAINESKVIGNQAEQIGQLVSSMLGRDIGEQSKEKTLLEAVTRFRQNSILQFLLWRDWAVLLHWRIVSTMWTMI